MRQTFCCFDKKKERKKVVLFFCSKKRNTNFFQKKRRSENQSKINGRTKRLLLPTFSSWFPTGNGMALGSRGLVLFPDFDGFVGLSGDQTTA